jgi:hypothetical protein
MDIIGFAHIDKNATTCKGAKTSSEFIGQTCAVMEFDSEGGVLCLNPQGTALAMFDKKDVYRKFECRMQGSLYVCPPTESMLETMAYVTKCMSRKGGYNKLLSRMVIEASLMKGKFNDAFLWQLQ